MNAGDRAFLACLEGRCGPCASCRAVRKLLHDLDRMISGSTWRADRARKPPLDTEQETVAAQRTQIRGETG